MRTLGCKESAQQLAVRVAFLGAMFSSSVARPEELPIVYYGDVSLNSTYVTPRGLVVADDGLTLKTLVGASFDFYRGDEGESVQRLALNIGAYTNFLSNPESLPKADGSRTDSNNIFDFDPYIGIDAGAFGRWKFSALYIPFLSPSGFYDAVHNVSFLAGYDDSQMLGDFAVHPYLRTFTTLSGDSPALVGKTPGSYVELGVAPKIPLPGDLGLVLSIPTAIFIGDEKFYGGSGRIGTISTGLLFIKPIGPFAVRAGVEYFYLANDHLRQASAILGNGMDSDRWIATVGLSFAFPG